MSWPRAIASAVGCSAVALTCLSWLLGAPVLWAALLTLPIGLLVLVLARSPMTSEPAWQPLPATDGALSTPQASALSGRLADAATDAGRFRSRIQPRLRELALARLRQAGVEDLTDPRAQSLLGGELLALLTDRGARMPGPEELSTLLARLEEL
ncbi:hypothetical protein BC739_006096 [Kutzneria viridogrisea]|uniref:Uncharacterized protein n=2 Tax=Kutzneria TaxID=43356 RepID=A0ABR6BPP9_9PSEU|nr:hypothetical protein [Kutzneria albida]AHH95921.1 putative secreted protein [Kutzneria albida DSM 43870]MBA8928879.1 hypothetical protein [Kutzneria viridogrisea]